jgi:hypothetical protein
MKKTFNLVHPKIKLARMYDAAKHEIKKYLKRERNKTLPAQADYWDFDCQYGATEQEAKPVHVANINKMLDQAEQQQLSSFYVEILAKPAQREHKPVQE